MVRVSEHYSGNWVKAEDLGGQDVTVEIEDVTVEEIEDEESGKTKTQIALHFVGMKKQLGLNKTNALTISGLYGDETDEWIGCFVTLFPTRTQLKGKPVDCIRIRDEIPEVDDDAEEREEPPKTKAKAKAGRGRGKKNSAPRF